MQLHWRCRAAHSDLHHGEMNRATFLADPALALREAAAFGEVLISEHGRTVAALVVPRRHPPPVGPRCDPEEHRAGAKGPPP